MTQAEGLDDDDDTPIQTSSFCLLLSKAC